MLRYWTADESHGKALLALVDGFPAGVEIETDSIDVELQRRQGGYGRGGRQRLDDLARPRPGHGDLTGAIKFLGSIRGVLERASARETTVRVAAGALAKQLLAQFGITAFGYVVEIGGERIEPVDAALD